MAARALALLVLVLGAALAAVGSASAAAWPVPADGTYVVPEFRRTATRPVTLTTPC
jgi:hypothetical protein